MDWLTRPGQLAAEPKVLGFRPEQQVCPIDGKRLKVLKTSTKTMRSTTLGTFQARHTELYCPGHKELGAFKSKDLQRIVPSDSNFAYDSLVEAGKQRYLHHLQIEEIKELFKHKFNLSISNSGVASLIKKFISCLSFIHHDHMEQIKDYIQAQGGYILHLDATCEGDSPKLTSSIDAVSGFILHSAKLKSENKADIMVFLRVIKEQLGIPHAIMSDMGRGIIKSVKAVFPDCPHYICHFHFLSVIGKLLFEEEHNILRKKISHYGVLGKLRALKRECENKYDRSALDQFIQNMNQPMKEVDEKHSFEPLVYSLVCWILDYRSIGNGYGFPFDKSYLECYRRFKESMKRIKIFLSYFSYNAKQTKILWRLHSIISEIMNDKRLGTTVNHYHIKVEVFERLRSALRAAPRDKQQGLSDLGRSVSVKELKAIETAVEKFNRYLDKKVLASKNKAVGDKLKRVQNHMQKYQHMLLSDPVEVKT